LLNTISRILFSLFLTFSEMEYYIVWYSQQQRVLLWLSVAYGITEKQ
jgi:hypothetical protein